jgi:flagellar hook-associated protein 3 FlgL
MRISTNTIYQLSTSQMTALQEKISQTSQQASTGKKVMTPQDDPVGSAKLLEAKQAISINDQYAVNRNALKYTIGVANVALNGIQDTMQSMNEQIVSLGSGTLNSSNRQSIALTLQSQLDHLVSLSNTKDAAGHYIFSGYKSDTAPITINEDLDFEPGEYQYNYDYSGDLNNAVIQVDSSTQLGLGVNAGSIFSTDFLSQIKATIDVLSDASSTDDDIEGYITDLATKFNESQIKVSAAQVTLGTTENRLTSMDSIGSERNLTYKDTVSSLEDVDYNKVLSDLARQQLQLQVAQKTFTQISNLSIFNYIK